MILSGIVAEVSTSECQKFGVLETVATATVRLLLKFFIMSDLSGPGFTAGTHN